MLVVVAGGDGLLGDFEDGLAVVDGCRCCWLPLMIMVVVVAVADAIAAECWPEYDFHIE